LIDRRWHSSVLDVQSFRGADCDTDMERFNPKKSDEVEGIEQHWVEISSRFAALENLDDDVHINRAWKTISKNITISAKGSLGYYELKKHKPWFDEGCSKLFDQRKRAKLQWLHHPSQINGDNFNSVKREASRHFRNKEKEYLKDIINELAANSKNKNIRYVCIGINEFKKGYYPRTNLVMDGNGDLLAE
jgi:hypothetical protein